MAVVLDSGMAVGAMPCPPMAGFRDNQELLSKEEGSAFYDEDDLSS